MILQYLNKKENKEKNIALISNLLFAIFGKRYFS